jgi:hypothetical protein
VQERDGRWCTERRQLTGRVAAARAGGGRRPGSLTGPEREGGGQAETVVRAEIQKSKKKNQF